MIVLIRAFLLFAFAVVISGCKGGNAVHVIDNISFETPFKFEGYVVDNGSRNWVYYLTGEASGIKIKHDADLMIHGDLFGCPLAINVEAKDGKIAYSLPRDSESEFRLEISDRCVKYYSTIFDEEVRKHISNVNSYEQR